MPSTIAALATPPGISGLAVIRLSGPESFDIADSCFFGKRNIKESDSHTIIYGQIKEGSKVIDTVTVSIFKSPNSYTGEDVVEISCHGGMIIYEEILRLLNKRGARLAEAGEFTKRAFLNGKLDLTQVEAVADIIHSVSAHGAQTAARQLRGDFAKRLKKLRQDLLNIAGLLELELDFSEEDLEFTNKEEVLEKALKAEKYCAGLAGAYRSSEILRAGFYVGIAGYPNSGKSTLFNTLLERKRAITSETPGTTRDYLEEFIYIENIAVKLVDTAGIRDTKDTIEIEGIKFVESILEESNLVLILNDISISKDNSDGLLKTLQERYPDTKIKLIQNKIDKIGQGNFNDECFISAKHGLGIGGLKKMIYDEAKINFDRVNDVLINQRHALLLMQASEALGKAVQAIESGLENSLIAIDIREAVKILGELTGESFNEEVINNIFSNFCIGK